MITYHIYVPYLPTILMYHVLCAMYYVPYPSSHRNKGFVYVCVFLFFPITNSVCQQVFLRRKELTDLFLRCFQA